jgi:hypothetical protein
MIRDDSLNAANPLGGPQLIGLGLSPKPKVRRQQFGPSLGGPIKPDKLFYFVSYDQQKRTFPAVVIPYSSSFLTSSGTAPGYNNAVGFFQGMVGPQAREGNQWVGLSKVDWNASPRNQFSSTINILRWDSPNGIQTAPTHGYHATANGSDAVSAETVIGRWTASITPAFLSEFRAQWGRDFEAQLPNAPGPGVSVTNGINFGMPNFLPRAAYPDEKRWQVSQNLNWVRGRHSLKFGYDLTQVSDDMINLYQGGGTYSFSALNDFALDCGNPAFPLPLRNCQAAATIPAGTIAGKHYNTFIQAFDTLGKGGATSFKTLDMAYYVEDTFRPVPALTVTVNIGLRYDLQTMLSVQGNPDVPATKRINTDWNNFGPRLGISWDPFGQQKTAVRVGGGVYYGRTQNSLLANLITNNGVPFKTYSFIPSSAGSPLFPDVLSGVPTGGGARPDLVFAAGDFANPAIYQTELSVEHEVFKDFTLSAIYMGNRGTTSNTVASVGFGSPTAHSFFASTTNKCAASKVLVACTSTLCRLPSWSVTVTVHQRIGNQYSARGEQKAKLHEWPARESLSLPTFNTALPVTDRALSTRERGRSRFPLREPIGPRPRGPVARTLWEREGNDPGASPCLTATDCARNPKTSRAALRVAVFAGHRSSPGIAGWHKPGGFAVESMRSYREIALDRCPVQPVRRCSRRPISRARRPS